MKRLREAIEVAGADFIGNANRFDLFKINSWAAAQEFVCGNTQTAAGAYVQDEDTFNQQFNATHHLYLFADENTNNVRLAVITGFGGATLYVKSLTSNDTVALEANFQAESAPGVALNASHPIKLPVPLFLIPGANFTNTKGPFVVTNNGTIKAFLPQLVSVAESRVTTYDLTNPEDGISKIDSTAFTYGGIIGTLILGDNIHDIHSHTITEDSHINRVGITCFEKPEDWSSTWCVNTRMTFGFGMSEEEIAAREEEARLAREAEERAEAERIAREEAARLEAERLAREAEERAARFDAYYDEAVAIMRPMLLDVYKNDMRYKTEGRYITITGSKHTMPYPQGKVRQCIIPPTIDGKLVTKIGAYAFYDEDSLQRIVVPFDLKMIERGALGGSSSTLNSYKVTVSKNTLVGRDNTAVNNDRLAARSPGSYTFSEDYIEKAPLEYLVHVIPEEQWPDWVNIIPGSLDQVPWVINRAEERKQYFDLEDH